MNGSTLSKDPGTVENRLTLNPAQFPFLNDWEDGMAYEATLDGNPVTLTQLGTGDFEVTSNAEPEAPEEQVGEVEEEVSEYGNPAVAKLGGMM